MVTVSVMGADRFFADSDWHMYEGRTAAQGGIVFGHEK